MVGAHTKTNLENFKAVHESGHALVAWFFGLTLMDVTIQPGRLKDGTEFSGFSKAIFPESERVESVNHRMFTVPRIYWLLAGRVATDLLIPCIPPGSGHAHDFETIKNLNRLDQVTIKMHEWQMKNPKADGEAFYQKFKEPVLKIINSKRGRRSIAALSRALVEARQLSGKEAARIISKAWGKPLPRWALPTEQHFSIVKEGPQSFNDLMSKILIYAQILKKELFPFYDSDKNSTQEADIIEKIEIKLSELCFLAMWKQLSKNE